EERDANGAGFCRIGSENRRPGVLCSPSLPCASKRHNYNNESVAAVRMSSLLATPGLRSQYTKALSYVAAVVLVVLGALVYLLATDNVSVAAFAVGLFATIAAAAIVVVSLMRSMAERFAAQLQTAADVLT